MECLFHRGGLFIDGAELRATRKRIFYVLVCQTAVNCTITETECMILLTRLSSEARTQGWCNLMFG